MLSHAYWFFCTQVIMLNALEKVNNPAQGSTAFEYIYRLGIKIMLVEKHLYCVLLNVYRWLTPELNKKIQSLAYFRRCKMCAVFYSVRKRSTTFWGTLNLFFRISASMRSNFAYAHSSNTGMKSSTFNGLCIPTRTLLTQLPLCDVSRSSRDLDTTLKLKP